MRISRLAAVGALSIVALAACGSDADDSGAVDTQQLQQVVRRVVGRWVSNRLRRRPMIIPVVVEA